MLMVVLSPTTLAVEQVIGVALLTAVPGGATSNFRILPMYSANVFFGDGHRKKCVSFVDSDQSLDLLDDCLQ